MIRSRFNGIGSLFALASALGCGEPSDRPSEVHTTRVLAVRSETPFTRPGSTAELRMLAYDGSPRAVGADGSRRETSTLWIGGCTNPPGDAYAGCMPYLHSVLEQFGDGPIVTGTQPATLPPGVVGWGESFAAQVPADIITSRSVAVGVAYPYGVQIVFFAYCGGRLQRVKGDVHAFPVGCFDAETGEPLGHDDFEFGFYPVFSYDTVENQNPTLNAVQFDGSSAGQAPACSDDAPCQSGYHCGVQGQCIPVVARCTKADKDDCENHVFAVDVPRASVEPAITAHVPAAIALPETLWVSYYATAGSFQHDSRIINDPHTGWSNDTSGNFRANVASGQEVSLWAIVRDDRNGVAWTEQSVWVE